MSPYKNDFIYRLFKRKLPIWMMRQAGRYLPEYRAIRERFPDFVQMCLSPDAACEITLQPIQRFDFDAAIIFSDILLIPIAFGVDVTFVEGRGPVLTGSNLLGPDRSFVFDPARCEEVLSPVLRAIQLASHSLSARKALIGFAGGAWTTLSYILEGEGSKTFFKSKLFALKEEKTFALCLEQMTEAICWYLDQQICAGANLIQLFESSGGFVPQHKRKEWVLTPTARIVSFLKKRHPQVPIIGFPRGMGACVEEYIVCTGVDGVSLDSSYPLERATQLPCVIQGNLDPVTLVAGGLALHNEIQNIIERFNGYPHIFNLGHGVLPQTPLENVYYLVERIRKHNEKSCCSI